MMFLVLLEIAVVLVALVLFLTQVAIPALRGLPTFPVVRARREARLHRQLELEQQAEVEDEIETAVHTKRAQRANRKGPSA